VYVQVPHGASVVVVGAHCTAALQVPHVGFGEGGPEHPQDEELQLFCTFAHTALPCDVPAIQRQLPHGAKVVVVGGVAVVVGAGVVTIVWQVMKAVSHVACPL
jgi:hypothetical protein